MAVVLKKCVFIFIKGYCILWRLYYQRPMSRCLTCTGTVDENDKNLARGLSSFASSEINKIKGKQSKEIEKILGYLSKSEIIHKDDMVKL